VEKVVQVKGGGPHFFFHAAGVLLGNSLGGLFDQADDVAHAEDASGETLGIEGFKLIDFLADAGELNGLLGHLSQGERGSAPRVAVELREDDAGEAEGIVEMLCDADGLLSGGRVTDEEHLLRNEEFLELFELLQERFVDFLASSRVIDLHISPLLLAPSRGLPAHAKNVGLSGLWLEHRNADLIAQGGKLFDSGRALKVASDQQGRLALGFQQAGKFGGRSRLARSIETHNEDSARFFEVEWRGIPAEQRGEFIVKDFDDLLAGRDAAQNILTKRLALDARDEVLGDPEMDIRLEKSHSDFAQGIGDILFADAPMPAEVFENVLKFVRKPGKHRKLSMHQESDVLCRETRAAVFGPS
jgi:hypothetical protein